ncbi:MAG: hypothetical protein Q9201_000740 [Fulgogasparrea decipioides]
MTEYEKLTVAKLREELVKRGLPKTGLKAVLVQRLVEADDQPTQAESESSDPQVKSPVRSNEEGNAPGLPEPQERQIEPAAVPTEGNHIDPTPPIPIVPRLDETPSVEPEKDNKAQAEPTPNGTGTDIPAVNGSENVSRIGPSERPTEEERVNHEAPTATTNGTVIQTEPEVDPAIIASEIPAELSDVEHIPTAARQDSLNTEEALEDTRRRKRRSVTPPPSAEPVQKKARIDDVRPHVRLPEDESMNDVEATPTPDAPVAYTTQAQEVTAVEATTWNDTRLGEDDVAAGEVKQTVELIQTEPPTEPALTGGLEPPEVPENQSRQLSSEPEAPTATEKSPEAPAEPAAKASPSNARFRNLLPASSRRDSSPTRHVVKAHTEDRVVSPALHPATTALYIRDILRPLHVENLKDHLISLATPSNAELDPAIIEDFFLDSIRTHCLVRFSTVAAASRVRTGLHDRVWPDEKNRKPLWVDFVPEEKLPQWFEVENASSGRGQAAKRWEVVYENEGDGVKAFLQEAGSNGSGLRKPQAAGPQTESGTGVRGAPLGPRVREHDQGDAQSRPHPDRGRGFQALDDLFKSTRAKPKLYYLPVPKRTADRRLDLLAEGRGGGRSDEMRRYSFEDELLVDRGPEFGSRGRGGYGGRRGSYGGYSNRGGGYRPDHWGDHRLDHRRDRR